MRIFAIVMRYADVENIPKVENHITALTVLLSTKPTVGLPSLTCSERLTKLNHLETVRNPSKEAGPTFFSLWQQVATSLSQS